MQSFLRPAYPPPIQLRPLYRRPPVRAFSGPRAFTAPREEDRSDLRAFVVTYLAGLVVFGVMLA